MATFTVGPSSPYPTIAAAMLAAGPADTIVLQTGYSNETATVTHNDMTISGGATSTAIVLQLGTGIPTIFLAGAAPIDVVANSAGGNGITGNDGDNVVTVTGGVDAVNGGLGHNTLIVDYSLATGAVTGDSTANFTEAGSGGRMVTITNGTFQDFDITTGPGADTLTVGDGNNIVNAGNGANTVTAGNGSNTISGGVNADTITVGNGNNVINAGDGANTVVASDGANSISGGNGANTITAGNGNDFVIGGNATNKITVGSGTDIVSTGVGAATIVAGTGADTITIHGGAATVSAGAGGNNLLVVDYSAINANVSG